MIIENAPLPPKTPNVKGAQEWGIGARTFCTAPTPLSWGDLDIIQ